MVQGDISMTMTLPFEMLAYGGRTGRFVNAADAGTPAREHPGDGVRDDAGQYSGGATGRPAHGETGV